MNLDDIYTIAKQIKPDFDNKIEQVANFLQGKAILPPLKSVERAREKLAINLDGDTSLLQVNDAYNVLSKRFDVVKEGSRNGYAKPIQSSDGYFDAKLDISVGGIFAEIQIHTQAMIEAKERVHSLYEQKQVINRQALKDGVRLTPNQKNDVELLNTQMREIYREANNG